MPQSGATVLRAPVQMLASQFDNTKAGRECGSPHKAARTSSPRPSSTCRHPFQCVLLQIALRRHTHSTVESESKPYSPHRAPSLCVAVPYCRLFTMPTAGIIAMMDHSDGAANSILAAYVPTAAFHRNRSAGMRKNSASLRMCVLLGSRLPLMTSEATLREPKMGSKSACFKSRRSIRYRIV